jgi:hypothetical protein
MVVFAVVGAFWGAVSAAGNGLVGLVTPVAERVAGFVAQVEVTPTAEGMPGGAMMQTLLNWTGQFGLWGSLLSILVGAAIWGVSQQFGNGYQSGKGKVLVGAGAIGAALTGLAAIIVNTLFTTASS